MSALWFGNFIYFFTGIAGVGAGYGLALCRLGSIRTGNVASCLGPDRRAWEALTLMAGRHSGAHAKI